MNKHIILTVSNDLNFDQRMIRVATTLRQAGYKVTLVGRSKTNSSPLKIQPYSQERLSLKHMSGPLFYKDLNRSLYKYIIQQSPDAIYAVDADTLWGAGQAASTLDLPLIYDSHELFTEVPELDHKPMVRAIWRQIERYYIPRTAVRITVGHALGNELLHRYGLPFEVLQNRPIPANTRTIRPKNFPQKLLLYQGALNQGRGLETLLKMMPLLPPDYILQLAGEGDLSNALRQMTATLGIADRVHFLGYIPPTDLPALTAQAYLGFNLLEAKSLNYYYSLANKFFDYVQAGLPAFHMDFPEYQQLMDEHQVGWLISGLEERALAESILSISPSVYEKTVANCTAAGKEWTWQGDLLVKWIGKIWKV